MIDLETPVAALLDSSHGKPKLLVVDDQPINIQVMYRCFAGDYQVFMATSGEQALALCLAQQPDLVLLDVMMPGMDGFEVCRRLKDDPTTLEDLAGHYGVSRERVRQIEVRAFEKLQKSMRAAALEKHLIDA